MKEVKVNVPLPEAAVPAEPLYMPRSAITTEDPGPMYPPLYTKEQMLKFAQAAVEKYRADLWATLIARHRKSKELHNYYACLAFELEEGKL